MDMILAMDRSGLIGRDGGLPWHAPRDLRWFKAVTMGRTIVMGRRTWESIGVALPGRISVVVSSQRHPDIDANVVWASDVYQALRQHPDAILIGGAMLCQHALQANLVRRCFRTWIEGDYEGDTYFDLSLLAHWQPLYTGQCPAHNGQPAMELELLLRP